jgi:hypothetical protein
VPEPGTTALVILLPAAEPILAAARRTAPALVRPGMPAHVTALYPFLPAAEVTGEVLDAARSLAAGLPPVDVVLTELVAEAGFAGIPVPSLQPVADAVCARWPAVLPYGGRFGPRPGAHVTVAMGGTDAELERVAAEVRPLLPLECRADGLHLVALTEDGWSTPLSAPFGDR